MDALLIVPAVAATFGGTYYLGKACLMLFVSSLEHSRNAHQPAAARTELPARALRSANTLVS